VEIIRDSQFGIHDVSRVELDDANRLPRFNMPLELGLFLRAKALAHVGARFISKEEGGTKSFDVRKWMSENPEIGEELRAASARD